MMLLVSSVNTPIHNSRFCLFAFALARRVDFLFTSVMTSQFDDVMRVLPMRTAHRWFEWTPPSTLSPLAAVCAAGQNAGKPQWNSSQLPTENRRTLLAENCMILNRGARGSGSCFGHCLTLAGMVFGRFRKPRVCSLSTS